MEDPRAQHAARRPQTSHGHRDTLQTSPQPLPQHHQHQHYQHSQQHQHHQHQQFHNPPRSPLRPSKSAAHLRPPSNPHDAPSPSNPSKSPSPHASPSPPPPPYELRKTQSPSASTPPKAPASSNIKKGWKRAQYVVSSVVSHPPVSTKHFSIIRHSAALVWYKGPTTSVTITILSDAPLPPNRKIMLLPKGFTGKLGAAFKSKTGLSDKVMDVTPTSEAGVQDLKPLVEEMIQRDLERFAAKASGRAKGHVARETHVIRIPAAAKDGYFFLGLYDGGNDSRKSSSSLCTSAEFRLVSTSADMASVSGASASTMPLELVLAAFGVVSNLTVKKYAAIPLAAVKSSAGKMIVKHSAKKAATLAVKGYSMLGGPGLKGTVQESWRKNREQGHGGRLDGETIKTALEVFASGASPLGALFPLKFSGKRGKATGPRAEELGFPFKGVPHQIIDYPDGVYVAWATIKTSTKKQKDAPLSRDWMRAVVTIGGLGHGAPSIANEDRVRICVDEDMDPGFEYEMDVLLMGYLHPPGPSTATEEELLTEHEQDLMITIACLETEPWDAGTAERYIQQRKSERTVEDRVNEGVKRVQQTVDSLPFHLLGIRSEAAVERDALIGRGGMWIAR